MNLKDIIRSCRVCLVRIEDNKSLSVFKKKNGILFSSFLCDLTSLKIIKNDGLPQTVCLNCVKKISTAFSLKTLAIESDSKLRQLITEDTISTANQVLKSEPGVSIKKEEEPTLEEEKKAIETQEPNDIIASLPIKVELEIIQNNEPQCTNKTAPTKRIKSILRSRSTHKIKIPGNGDIFCCMCVNYFKSTAELMEHAQVHDRTAPEEQRKDDQMDCAICLRRYQNYKGYRLHLRRKYLPKKKKDYVCRICGKVFSTHTSLMYCERKHEGKLPRLECALCNLVSTSRSNLIAHMEIHRGIKNFSCEICGTRFRMLNNMQKHRLTHTLERPHSCSICKKTFARTSSLSVHMRVHSGERPFSCKFCEKTFIHTSDCRRHEMSHTGERPYTCSFCDKSFKTGTLLRVHLPIHSGVKPFKCNVCNIEYYQKKSLNRHMREKHPLVLLALAAEQETASLVTVTTTTETVTAPVSSSA